MLSTTWRTVLLTSLAMILISLSSFNNYASPDKGFSIKSRKTQGVSHGICPKCRAINKGTAACWKCGASFLNPVFEEEEIIITTKDQARIADLAKNHPLDKVRQAAIMKLTDQSVISEIFEKDASWSLREAAATRLTDQKLLEKAAQDKNDQIRQAAVSNPHFIDQGKLLEIAKVDEYAEVRRIAVSKMTDQAALAEVMKNEQDFTVLGAIRDNPNISDQRLLYLVIKKIGGGPDPLITLIEMKINDQVVLGEISKESHSPEVRLAAVKKLVDQDLLLEAAISEKKNYEVISTALSKLTDQYAVKALNSASVTVRRFITADRINDRTLLGKIAKTDPDFHVRVSAINKLDDPGILKDIARNDAASSIREAAIRQITDQDFLEEIAITDRDKFIREEAVRKLTNPMVLRAITNNDSQDYVRAAAEKRLQELEKK